MTVFFAKIGIQILNFLEKYLSLICFIGNKRYVIKDISTYDLISYIKITLHSKDLIYTHFKNDTPTVKTLRKFYLCNVRNKYCAI